jgi:hypothetical protein
VIEIIPGTFQPFHLKDPNKKDQNKGLEVIKTAQTFAQTFVLKKNVVKHLFS